MIGLIKLTQDRLAGEKEITLIWDTEVRGLTEMGPKCGPKKQ